MTAARAQNNRSGLGPHRRGEEIPDHRIGIRLSRNGVDFRSKPGVMTAGDRIELDDPAGLASLPHRGGHDAGLARDGTGAAADARAPPLHDPYAACAGWQSVSMAPPTDAMAAIRPDSWQPRRWESPAPPEYPAMKPRVRSMGRSVVRRSSSRLMKLTSSAVPQQAPVFQHPPTPSGYAATKRPLVARSSKCVVAAIWSPVASGPQPCSSRTSGGACFGSREAGWNRR